jgi:hypothetical protein
MFRHRQVGDEWLTRIGTARYRALTRADLERFLVQAGFVDIAWHEPENTGHHQPLATALRQPG